MKWEVIVKILLWLILEGLVISLLWFTEDAKMLGTLIAAISSLAGLVTFWSIYEDLKNPQVQQVIRT